MTHVVGLEGQFVGARGDGDLIALLIVLRYDLATE